MRIILLLLITFLPFGNLTAQVSPLPDTGCPGTLPPFTSGSTRLGDTILVQCDRPSLSVKTWLLVGLCPDRPTPLPFGIMCFHGCSLAIDLFQALVVLDGLQPLSVSIPDDPSLLGLKLCAQCLDLFGFECLLAHEAVELIVTN